MDTRVAVLAIIVREGTSVAALNDLLHQYGKHIIGRMGVPYHQRGHGRPGGRDLRPVGQDRPPGGHHRQDGVRPREPVNRRDARRASTQMNMKRGT